MIKDKFFKGNQLPSNTLLHNSPMRRVSVTGKSANLVASVSASHSYSEIGMASG